MSLKYFFLCIFLLEIPILCHAQKLVLTTDGICSSENGMDYVEYKSKELGKKELFESCKNLLSSPEFLSYIIEPYNNEKIIVKGYIKSKNLLVLGKSEVLFKLNFEFEDHNVRVRANLTKVDGQNYNVFTTKGKVRITVPKDKIEAQINTLIEQIVGDIVIINP